MGEEHQVTQFQKKRAIRMNAVKQLRESEIANGGILPHKISGTLDNIMGQVSEGKTQIKYARFLMYFVFLFL